LANQTITSDSGRGRNAHSPQEIPATGWKDLLLRTYREINDDRVTLIAAAVTYYLLLSLFPTITAFVSIYGLFADPATVAQHIGLLAAVVPEGGMAIINEQLTKLTSTGGITLGFALFTSVGIALWSASSGVKTVFEAMNVAYDEREDRNFFVLNGTALLFTFAFIVGAMLMIAAAVLVPAVLAFIGLETGFEWLLRVGSYVVLSLVLMLGLAAIYRFGPSRRQAKWRWVSLGAIFATIIILVISLLFSWYAANFGNYDATYGSLGGLIALLSWMWMSVTAVIVGAELNSEAERQTERDSTTGTDSPLGHRDAVVADTVGDQVGEAHNDEGVSGKSVEWLAGYNAAKTKFNPQRRHSLGAMTAALPLALALGAFRRRERK
jgi:membrane protein